MNSDSATDGRYCGSPAAAGRRTGLTVREAVGTGFPIIYRFSQWKAKAYDAQLVATPAELEQVLAPLVAAGVDVLHPSTRRVYVPAFAGSDLSLAGGTKKIAGVLVIGVGSVGLATEFQPGKRDGDPIVPAPVDRLLAQFAAEELDIVAIGRALLADPGG